METKEDLLFLARLYHEIDRNEDAIDVLDRLASAYPDFNKTDRNVFAALYKELIDKYRTSTRTIRSFYLNEINAHHLENVDVLRFSLQRAYRDLQKVCNGAIKVIKEHLLPHGIDPVAKLFFHKMEGDMNRYLAECGTMEELKEYREKAEQAYDKAMEIEGISPVDPTLLAVVLNRAVLLHEHLHRESEGAELLSQAMEKMQANVKELQKLTADERQEADNSLRLMKENLKQWGNRN